MGRTGKASTTTSTIKGQSSKDTKECVSEDTISKLMKDFTCASLLTNVAHSSTKDQGSSQQKETHANCCEEIVSSLKHFHLKPPVNKRTRLKEKRMLQRKAKAVMDNKYNLSVAAIHTQKSVVWPGKLNCLSTKSNTNSNIILRPSKLFVSGITDKPLCTSSIHSHIQTSSSEEKTRIAATLTDQNLSRFGSGSTNLSFSKLYKRHLKDSSNESASHHENASGSSSSIVSVPPSIKSQGYRNSTASKHQQTFNFSIDHNQSCNPLGLSGYQEDSKKKTSLNNSSSQQQQQKTLPHSRCDSIFSHSRVGDYVNNNITPTDPREYQVNSSIIQSSNMNPAVGGGIAPERSCSEEMRMEESNVNELASYFEDLLHIPRKMSVMAEMMYA